jgi:hypothetical protein
MAATITLTTAPTVLRRFARTATLATIRMPVRLTDTGDLITSWAVCSLELARGGDGDSVTGFTVTADSATDFTMVTDLMVMGSLAAVSMAGRDLGIGQDSPTVADSVVDSPAVEDAAARRRLCGRGLAEALTEGCGPHGRVRIHGGGGGHGGTGTIWPSNRGRILGNISAGAS